MPALVTALSPSARGSGAHAPNAVADGEADGTGRRRRRFEMPIGMPPAAGAFLRTPWYPAANPANSFSSNSDVGKGLLWIKVA